ncbi:hypothetical protein [Stackebrandtia soli]|uniref:hypothetical protein n=1 Tax=Stackebrandtia soli TaxID=1892856 RepID=UPI0039E81AA5
MASLTGPTGTVSVSLRRGIETRPATLLWWRGDPYRVELDDGTGRCVGTGPDLFAALVELRRCLDADGWLPAVRGGRLDAYPSGMAREMGGGERVYINRMGRAAETADLVDTLEPEPDASTLASVADQLRYHEDWLAS